MKYKISSIKSSSLKDKMRAEQVEAIVCYILENNKSISPDHTLSTKEILNNYGEIKKKHPDTQVIPINSISTYTSYLSKLATSPIRCQGKKQGYFLDPSFNLNYPEETQLDYCERKEYSEKDMYPLLLEWLKISLKNETFKRVEIVSDKHILEKWRNPDILGIVKLSYFGTTHLELTTIEAKLSIKNWRTDIFEAVSHTLLANKAYYAYLCKETDKDENIDEMALYSQKFGIGILAIVVPDDRWGKDLEFGHVTFKLIAPPALQSPPQKTQKAYLNGLKITDIDSLEKWGSF